MLYLHGIGHFHPHTELDNRFFESLDIGTDEQWIVERTGIRTRRSVLPLDYIRHTRNRDVRAAADAAQYSNADLGTRAAVLALARAGITAADVGLVIGGGSVPDHGTPAEACIIADQLGIVAPALDLRSACTSFGAALWLLSSMRETALAPYVLVVMTETVTRSVDYDDRRSAILWGDGAVAAVLSTRVPGRARIDHTTFDSRPSGHDKVVVPWAGYFGQQGQAVQTFAIKTTSALLDTLRQQLVDDGDRDPDERFFFIGHQANYRMLQSVARRCGLDDDQHLHNVVDFGNTATAGSPSVLSAHWDDLRPGDQLAIVGVGAGFSWSSMAITVGGDQLTVSPPPRPRIASNANVTA